MYTGALSRITRHYGCGTRDTTTTPHTFASSSSSSSARCDWNLEYESNPSKFLYLLYLNS